MGISIHGLGAAMARLEAIGGAMAPAATQGLQVAAEEVRSAAAQLCPVETGTMRGSIQARVTGAAGGAQAIISTAAHQAGYVEMGTWKMAAQPFMYPAAKGCQGAVVQAVAEAVRAAL